MSFRGRGGGRGGSSARGGRGGMFNAGPPASVMEFGSFKHAVEDEMLCASTDAQHVPYFNAPILCVDADSLENKTQIGKVDEILGPINEVYFTVKTEPGVVASSFKASDKVYISSDRILPIERFLPKPKAPKGAKKRGSGRGGAPARGGRGGFGGRGGMRGGRGGARGAPCGRGGFGGAPRGRGGFRGRGGY